MKYWKHCSNHLIPPWGPSFVVLFLSTTIFRLLHFWHRKVPFHFRLLGIVNQIAKLTINYSKYIEYTDHATFVKLFRCKQMLDNFIVQVRNYHPSNLSSLLVNVGGQCFAKITNDLGDIHGKRTAYLLGVQSRMDDVLRVMWWNIFCLLIILGLKEIEGRYDLNITDFPQDAH